MTPHLLRTYTYTTCNLCDRRFVTFHINFWGDPDAETLGCCYTEYTLLNTRAPRHRLPASVRDFELRSAGISSTKWQPTWEEANPVSLRHVKGEGRVVFTEVGERASSDLARPHADGAPTEGSAAP